MWCLLSRKVKGSPKDSKEKFWDDDFSSWFKILFVISSLTVVAFLPGAKKRVARRYGKTLSPSTPSWPLLPLPMLPVPGPHTKAHCIQLFGCFVPVGFAPFKGPFLAFLFSSLKRPQGGPRAQWLGSQVASQRRCCSIERHVESQGEREEDIINHELLKARREKGELVRAGRTELKWRIFFFSCSCCCRCWRERSWTSAQTHAELKKQQDKFLKNELGEGKELGVGGSSEKEPRNDSNPQTKEAPADQPSPSLALLWFKHWFV